MGAMEYNGQPVICRSNEFFKERNMNRTKWFGLMVVAGVVAGWAAPVLAQDAGTIKGKVIFKGDKDK